MGNENSMAWQKNFFLRAVLSMLVLAPMAFAQSDAEEVPASPKAAAASRSPSATASSNEPWKGPSDEEEFTASALVGVGFLNGMGAPSFLVALAKKIVNRGFAEDINDQVFLELQAGPLFFLGETDFLSNLHLRWDFHKDDQFGLYAIGGVGAVLVTQGLRGGSQFYPRFGIGASYQVEESFSLRAELSREFMGVGVNYHF